MARDLRVDIETSGGAGVGSQSPVHEVTENCMWTQGFSCRPSLISVRPTSKAPIGACWDARSRQWVSPSTECFRMFHSAIMGYHFPQFLAGISPFPEPADTPCPARVLPSIHLQPGRSPSGSDNHVSDELRIAGCFLECPLYRLHSETAYDVCLTYEGFVWACLILYISHFNWFMVGAVRFEPTTSTV